MLRSISRLSLIHPAALIDIVVATSATRPGEAHLHYHNQEVDGVDDEGDDFNCVGHDDRSCDNVVYVERVMLLCCLAHDSVLVRLTCHIELLSIDESTAHR